MNTPVNMTGPIQNRQAINSQHAPANKNPNDQKFIGIPILLKI